MFFDVFDSDSSGTIDAEEFGECVSCVMRFLCTAAGFQPTGAQCCTTVLLLHAATSIGAVFFLSLSRSCGVGSELKCTIEQKNKKPNKKPPLIFCTAFYEFFFLFKL